MIKAASNSRTWLLLLSMPLVLEACASDATQCGDSVCNPMGESCLNCPSDCGPCNASCGDGICAPGETCSSCSADCGDCQAASCGDGTCDPSETCTSCRADCGTCPGAFCGDGTCDPGETCSSCSADCGACPGAFCGDGTCDPGETCASCSADCGACQGASCGDGTCDPGESHTTCPQDCDDWPADWAAKEDEILSQINAFRASSQTCGTEGYPAVGSLVMDPALRLAARLHAQDMADNNYFSHTGLDGSTPVDRITAAGFTGGCPCGENIAAGNSDASATMVQWANSTGHCQNMMTGGYSKIGVGYAYNPNSTYHHYWVQVFGD